VIELFIIEAAANAIRLKGCWFRQRLIKKSPSTNTPQRKAGDASLQAVFLSESQMQLWAPSFGHRSTLFPLLMNSFSRKVLVELFQHYCYYHNLSHALHFLPGSSPRLHSSLFIWPNGQIKTIQLKESCESENYDKIISDCGVTLLVRQIIGLAGRINFSLDQGSKIWWCLFISGLASSYFSLNGDTFRSYLFAHSARVLSGNIAQFDAKLVSSQ